MNNSDHLLKQLSKYLDISPSDFKVAQRRFNAVKEWLRGGVYQSGSAPDIYLQGSFRLGTVVRPFRGDKDGEFDIDQVCELSIPSNLRLPEILKHDIGNRLKEDGNYEKMLDDEGCRCWTLEYASEDGRPGFHIDIVPSLHAQDGVQYQIDITHKHNTSYTWSVSNPRGYYYWFKSKNVFTDQFISEQRREIFEENRETFSGINAINEIPKELVRSNLQRAIQIMKRHRDVYFSKMDFKPISIIITTITTQVNTQNSIFQTINDFVDYVLNRYESLISNGYLVEDGILDYLENEWLVPNPVNYGGSIENFADKWKSNLELEKNFFGWVYQLKRDLEAFRISGVSDDLNLRIPKFGDGETYAVLLENEIRDRNQNANVDTNKLLELIHLGIEKKMEWEPIKQIAISIFNNQENPTDKDIAKINYYQIALHRGIGLADDAVEYIKKILAKHQENSAFVMCCNLLLGTVTHEMIRRCLRHGYDKPMEWPIMKLAKNVSFFPR
jgi:Second Messenger Oligonucleotide or Dinucleotide Synthetase domain